MKKITLSLITILFCVQVFSQSNYSGTYSYSFPLKDAPANVSKNDGPTGSLILLKLENNKYRFWLDINKGWPSYNMGESDGTIVFVNDTASFDNTYEGASSNCILFFKASSATVKILTSSTAYNCGFGNGVYADGSYNKDKKQAVLDNKWLRIQYSQSPTVVVTENKVQLFEDQDMLHPKNQYFVKGDSLLSIAETEKSIYTEYFSPAGKFIYGWMKKTSLKNVSTD